MKHGVSYWWVQDQWHGATVAIIGGGPSLTQAQCEAVRGRCRVIAINDAIRPERAPWADVHYFCDAKWWRWHRASDWYRAYEGVRVTLENPEIVAAEPAVRSIRNYGWNPEIAEQVGLSALRDGVITGMSGGYQAINLAVHLGARRLLLLGYDLRDAPGRTHWFGDHPDRTSAGAHALLRRNYEHLCAPLRRAGVRVVNCTPGSALNCFEAGDLEAELGIAAQAA